VTRVRGPLTVDAMDRHVPPKFRPDKPAPGKGVGDPAYMLAEIKALRALAEASGWGTLDYLLHMAEIEAKRELEAQRERDTPP
jgi:hypothetical protein